MIREEYGQMAHQTLPNILLSNLVTKSCIAWFVDDDAFNPSALSNCSMGPSPPLAHGKSTLPVVAIAGQRRLSTTRRPAYLAAFARFPNKRFIAVGKFECDVKDHLSMFWTLRFRVLRCSRNCTFLRAFVNTLSFFGLRQASQCQRLYSTPATDAPVLVFDRSGRPSSPSPPRPPTPTDRGPRRRGAGPSSSRLWQRFLLQRPFERRKTANFLATHAKMYHFYSTEGHEPRV